MSMQEIHPHRTGFETKIIVIIVNTKVMQAMRYTRVKHESSKAGERKSKTLLVKH